MALKGPPSTYAEYAQQGTQGQWVDSWGAWFPPEPEDRVPLTLIAVLVVALAWFIASPLDDALVAAGLRRERRRRR